MSAKSLLGRINDALWDERFWLPTNMTWQDFSPPSNDLFNYTSGSDLLMALPIALGMLAIRYPLERWCFRPVGLYLGIESRPHKKIPPVGLLEKAYASHAVVDRDKIVSLSKQLDWTERQVERWLRHRRASEKPTTLVKFTESFWRLFYYATSFAYGGYCIWDKPWTWDSSKLLADPPFPIADECWWYCVVSCGFYLSLLLSQLSDVKRKDRLEMTIHHVVVIVLVSFTWIVNMHRFIVLGFFMFDMSDVVLELVKMTKYARLEKTTAVLYILMTLTWLATRWVWYPFWILRVSVYDCYVMYGSSSVYFVLNGLLVAIGTLNAVWTYFILNTLFYGLVQGVGETKDPRSSGEEEALSDGSEPGKERR